MEPQLQRVEVQALCGDDDDLAVDDTIIRQSGEQRIVQVREVAVERTQVAALDVDLVAAPEDDGPEPVPLRFEDEAAVSRQFVRGLTSGAIK